MGLLTPSRAGAASAGVCLLLAACASAAIPFDSAPGGFVIYRSGRVARSELARLCRDGVREFAVLDGTAQQRECRWRAEVCPELRIRYDEPQDPDRPLDASFLRAFDAWVEDARAEGRGIAFRCRHGWHRAGRLAAYYRMRFDSWSLDDALGEMHARGRMMWGHPSLDDQVRAMADFLAGRPCSVPARFCVRPGEPGSGDARFPRDACEDERAPPAAPAQ